MIDDPLCGPKLKIKRANHHISYLQDALKAFRENNPYRIRRKYDAELQWLYFIFDDCKPIPPEISLSIGEALYQQRSALDHLVWKLIANNSKTPPPKSGFPIFTTTDGYKTRSPAMIKGIRPGAAKLIRELQPFQRGAAAKLDPLWVLQELNNTDKHRFLIVAQSHVGPTRRNISMTVDAYDIERKRLQFAHTVDRAITIKNGAEFFRIKTADPEKKIDFKFSCEIAINEAIFAKPYLAIPTLTKLSAYVDRIIDSFRAEFI
jgi:hypothetical protein